MDRTRKEGRVVVRPIPPYTPAECTTTKFVITLPSGYRLKIEFGPYVRPQEDIEFVERIVRLAYEEGENS